MGLSPAQTFRAVPAAAVDIRNRSLALQIFSVGGPDDVRDEFVPRHPGEVLIAVQELKIRSAYAAHPRVQQGFPLFGLRSGHCVALDSAVSEKDGLHCLPSRSPRAAKSGHPGSIDGGDWRSTGFFRSPIFTENLVSCKILS
jgi:hypothetical protein